MTTTTTGKELTVVVMTMRLLTTADEAHHTQSHMLQISGSLSSYLTLLFVLSVAEHSANAMDSPCGTIPECDRVSS